MFHYSKDQTPRSLHTALYPILFYYWRRGVCGCVLLGCVLFVCLCSTLPGWITGLMLGCWSMTGRRELFTATLPALHMWCRGSEEELTHVIVMSINGFSGSAPLFRYSQSARQHSGENSRQTVTRRNSSARFGSGDFSLQLWQLLQLSREWMALESVACLSMVWWMCAFWRNTEVTYKM